LQRADQFLWASARRQFESYSPIYFALLVHVFGDDNMVVSVKNCSKSPRSSSVDPRVPSLMIGVAV
jgi:hypothetical protein